MTSHTAEVDATDAPAPGPVPALPVAGPVPLNYAGTLTQIPWFRRILRTLYDLGPLFPRPSLLTLALVLACAAATFHLARRPEAWRPVRGAAVGRANGPFPSTHYLPAIDAIVSANRDGGLRLWRPWTDEVLLETEPPPAALPPNPPPGPKGQSWWVAASADESRLLAKSDLGTFVWDARTGRLVAKLDGAYLGPEAANRPYLSLGGLSPDGSHFCGVNHKGELLLYDLSGNGPRAAFLAKQQLPPMPKSFGRLVLQPTCHVRFSPDGRHVLVFRDTHLWLGHAATLQQVHSFDTPYSRPHDVAFLRGGERMLVLFPGFGGAREVRLYDPHTGRVLRRWPMPDDPTSVAVSPDESRAVVTVIGQAAVVLDLNDGVGAAPRRAALARWPMSAPAFFADNRRVVAADVWRRQPGVIDLATGRHVANLRVPSYFARDAIPSPDGRQVAVVSGIGIHVFENVKPDSAWGVLAEGRFWFLASCAALLVGSLCRDALRSRRRRGRTTPIPRPRVALVGALVATGGAALLCPAVWLALGLTPDLDLDVWWFDDGWLVWSLVLYLPAGLGLLAGSRMWTALLVALLPASAGVALWLTTQADGFAVRPELIFDRTWLIEPSWVVALHTGWVLLALAGLAALGRREWRGRAVV